MLPYFLKIKNLNFKEDVKKNLKEYVLKNLDKFDRNFNKVPYKYGSYDGNWYLPKQYMPFDLLDTIGNLFKIKISYEILAQSSFTNGRIHRDGNYPNLPPRSTVINFPIYPDNCTIGTKFYNLEEGSYDDFDNAIWKEICEVTYEDNHPVILNTQKWHAVQNNVKEKRFCAQITTDLKFTEVVNLYIKNKLY